MGAVRIGPPLRDAAERDRPHPRARPGAAARPRDQGRALRSPRRSGRGDDLRRRAARGARAPAARARDGELRRDRRADRARAAAEGDGRRVRPRDRERRPRPRRRRPAPHRRQRAERGSYSGRHMIHPRIDTLLDNVDSRYALVIVAAKRARQINNYHHQLGEGTFDEMLPPLVESRSKNYLTMSLEEVAQGKIKYEYRR